MVSAEEFKNPPVKYRIKPFWFWNGHITKEEIRRQIREMAEKGLGGMFICARQGMTVPYLSKEWFDLVEYACKESREQGLEAWLYDEYPYPSGMSGGEVLLEHPEAEHMVLSHKMLEAESGQEICEDLGWSRILFAKAFPADENGTVRWDEGMELKNCVGNLQTEKIYQQTGLTKYNKKRFFSYHPAKLLKTVLPEHPHGSSWRIEIYMEMAMGDFKYYGGFFDPCNKEAVKTFIDTTHERYKAAVGDQFGITVHGMFSDEVGLLSPIPWSRRLPEEFEKRRGYSLLEVLPAIHDPSIPHADRIRYDLYQTAHEVFRESYHQQVSEWCRKNHLQYATEVPSMRHSTQRFSDIPGGDTAHEKLGKSLEWIYDEYLPNYRSNAKAVSSLARQLGKDYAMIESFHSVGWTMTLQDAKWMIDRLGSSGINLYNFHAFYYTIQDITKHDAPPSQFLQNPYWRHYRKLADYVGRMGVMVTNTQAQISIAVLDPAAALWTRLGNPFHGFPYKGESEEEKKECDRLRNRWVTVCKALLFAQLDYDHLDAELLMEAEITEGEIRLGRAAYSVVILPPCHCMEAGARRKLETFAAQGGCVIGLETLPFISIDRDEEDEETRAAWENLFASETCHFLEKDDESGSAMTGFCRTYLKEKGRLPVECSVTAGNCKDVITAVRSDEEGTYYVFAANQGKEPVQIRITAEPGSAGDEKYLSPGRYDLETGEIKAESADTARSIVLSLESFESRWICLGMAEAPCYEAEQKTEVRIIPMEGDWKVSLEGMNLCRFGRALLSVDGESWRETETKTFIEQCSSLSLLKEGQIRYEGQFGTPKKLRPAYPLDCRYRISFRAEEIPDQLCLLMDRESAAGEMRIMVNGTELSKTLWKPIQVNDPNNRAADISRLICLGENELQFYMRIRQDEEGLRDPVYLMGNFGVEKREGNLTLTAFPHTSRPDGSWYKGFPYYSGRITFEKELELEAVKQDEFDIRLGLQTPCYDCIELEINGVSLGVRAFAPYVWKGRRELLKPGKNTVRVTVTNTLANMLDGTYFDYNSHRLEEVLP